MKINSQRDFTAGLLFSAFGVAFAWGATTYNVGSGARMGPGYFPLIVGILIAVMGVLITARSFITHSEDGDPIGAIAWRPLGFIIGANLVFGVLLGGLPSIGLPPMGLVVAIYALTLIASLAGDQFQLKGVLVLATVLSVGSYLAFVVALNLQFPVWPTFITG
ncbi:MAG TPA: tripartite tricarboxylate transporter TctB family protein [Alicycliphilus sp.]|uniref:Tripartite tricarboxylate transporter TctB family protein n=1 Tax=Diaphorobacter limosus TaxID=3036128 RepID=A0ABZ0J424_9BURK|nr:tripartite tricarboxylate transporter TctB family protein [Diaphorobacter sp. Y-1]MBP6752434.1 tripartite tricarboxylate transporter TctB family protein [Alicycliphilus sp.]MBP7324132.1 tripartite tricarboxylate transporter TctB family protein [Alicycliphilus sp.]MBP7328619.1 tripartite tricarboxylate transporter TctB family protein [Alicycliphilus sp.]MBP8780497.1 tripartite tricarboxylate transporter TctB family protein [Alicycliphilus sp.]WOO32926.1 tripartite tricarboxylate transporter 